MSSDEDVDEFGRTRVKNRKRSASDSPPARYKRPNKRSPRRSPARRSRSPAARRRSRSPKKSSPPRRDRSPHHRRAGREQRSPPNTDRVREEVRPNVREEVRLPIREDLRPVRRKEGSAPPRRKEDVGPTFDSAVDSYVNSLKKIPRVRNVNPADEDDDDPVLAAALEDDTNLEDEQMAKLLGFSSFDTTKGKKTDGSSNASASAKVPKRKYRQYMNRRGGFNRPLDPIL